MNNIQVPSAAAATAYFAANPALNGCFYFDPASPINPNPKNLGTTGEQPIPTFVARPPAPPPSA
jgi:hypothetical protein